MDPTFWHNKWSANQIAFHEGQANAHLVAQLPVLDLAPDSRLLLPLCGKTRDIGWLLSRGHRVVGVELSPLAIDQLFRDLALTPTITSRGRMQHYSAERIDILVGDIFDATPEMVGTVDAVYDRAALVALPPDLRPRYADHIRTLSHAAQQLLICFEYDQNSTYGPPFSVTADEVATLYAGSHIITKLARTPVDGGLRGTTPAHEVVWHLA